MKDAAKHALEYPVTLTPVPEEDGGGFYASSEQFPGILGDGASADDAIKDFREILADVIQERLDEGRALPPVKSVAYEYSGKLSLRIARSIHAKAAECAKHDGISINQWIANAIAMNIGEHGAQHKPLEIHLSVKHNYDGAPLRQSTWPSAYNQGNRHYIETETHPRRPSYDYKN